YILQCSTSESRFTVEDPREERSRIISYNGSLFFQAGINRNIYFKNDENSPIFIATLKNLSILNFSDVDKSVYEHEEHLIIFSNLNLKDIIQSLFLTF
ncbi:hypothetical protein PMAYCL1PPCAC_27527, partial [Pristionchus mayeri]